jgi:hypothetical protein
MPIKIVKKPVVADVEVEQNKTVTKAEQVPVKVVDVGVHTANVGFSAAYTKNLGNYESLKITVSLFMPVTVDPTKQGANTQVLEDTFLYVQAWVDKKVNDVLDELNQ